MSFQIPEIDKGKEIVAGGILFKNSDGNDMPRLQYDFETDTLQFLSGFSSYGDTFCGKTKYYKYGKGFLNAPYLDGDRVDILTAGITSNADSLHTHDSIVYDSSGCLTEPSYTDNGSGNITVNSVDVALYDNCDYEGTLTKYTLSAITVTLTDHVTNYVVADYNSGSPILRVTTDVSEIDESCVIPVLTIVRTGSVLHTINWDKLGQGMSEKIHLSIIKTQRYRRESGVSISEYGTRNINVSSGVIWIGCNPVTIDTVLTATDKLIFCYHSGGTWVSDFNATQYNNTQYDNGTNLATLTANRYAVNWVFRGVESQKHVYVILGTGDYTLAQAQSATVPSPPDIISSHATLVGKIIVQKNAATATSVQSAFDTAFTYATPTNHNDLTNIQGGTTNEYYHLTQSQSSSLTGGIASNSDSLHTHARNIVSVTAGSSISALRVITLDTTSSKAIYADKDTAGHALRILGVSINAVNTDETLNIITAGYMYDATWTWDMTKPIFLSTSGNLTQTAPTTGSVTVVGFPVATNAININIGQTLILA